MNDDWTSSLCVIRLFDDDTSLYYGRIKAANLLREPRRQPSRELYASKPDSSYRCILVVYPIIKMLFGTRISRSKLLAVVLLLSLHTVVLTNVLADQAVGTEGGPTVAELKREGDTFVRAGKFADAGRSYSQALGE
jgi:hypothetical protein